jgi:L-asparagine transporter-like permease
LVFSLSGGFKQLAIIASASLLVVYFGVVAATIKLRLKETDKSKGFRLPFGVAIPVLAAISIIWFLSNLAMKEITSLVVFLGVLSVLYILIEFYIKRNNNTL